MKIWNLFDLEIKIWDLIVGQKLCWNRQVAGVVNGILHPIQSSPDVGKVKWPIKKDLRKNLGPEISRE